MSLNTPPLNGIPFARDSVEVNVIPDTSGTSGAASWTEGFPPETMIPITSGGIPPSGQDFNGVMRQLSQHQVWLNAGGQYKFNAALATVVGGYALGAVVQSDDNSKSYVNSLAGNTSNPNTGGANWSVWNDRLLRSDLASSSGSSLVGYGGITQKEFNDQAALWSNNVLSYFTLAELAGWRANPSTYNVTRPFQAALDDTAKYVCHVPEGIYLISGLTINRNNFAFIADTYARAILTMDNTAAFALMLGNTASTSGIRLRGIKLLGNSNNLGGIKLGDATRYAAFTVIDDTMIDGFTGATACDFYLGSVQELDVRNTVSWNGRTGFYRPNLGYCTSTRISGKNGYIGRHLNRAVLFEGQADDFYINDVIIEGNSQEAIEIKNTAFNSTRGVRLYLTDAYFEANGNSGVGTATVLANGNAASSYLKLHVIRVTRCNFAAHLLAPVGFKNIIANDCMLMVTNNILLPDEVQVNNKTLLQWNENTFPSGADIFTSLKALGATARSFAARETNLIGSAGIPVVANFTDCITFPSVNKVATDPNTLDDYEEGTWTPVVTGNGGAYTTVTGRFTKIGNVVHFWAGILTQNFTSTANTTTVSLPMGSMTIGSVSSFVNTITSVGGVALCSGGNIFLPTLASQGANAFLIFSGSYQTTL